MQTTKDINHCKNAVVALGQFDGMDREQMALLHKIAKIAKDQQKRSICIVVSVEGQKTLLTQKEKLYYINQAGIDEVVFRKFSDTTKEEHARHFSDLIQTVQDTNPYKILSEVQECPSHKKTHRKLVEAVLAGRMEEFAEIAGHNYIVIETVEHGNGLGHTVGMPTANLDSPKEKILPFDGVYATIAYVGKLRKMGLTNFGQRPSVRDFNYKIETNILDFSDDIYGEEMLVEVCFFIRGVMSFGSLEEVKSQVDIDRKNTYQKLHEIFE